MFRAGQQKTAADVATGEYRVLFSARKLLYCGGERGDAKMVANMGR